MKVFITKHALSTGVVEEDVDPTNGPDVVRADWSCYRKPHWASTKEEAIEQVRKLVARRIKSATTLIAKLTVVNEKLDRGILP